MTRGKSLLIHARSRDRGRPALEQLGGETTLVTGDLAQLDQVHRLADQIHANGPVDALVHNAGVWVRGNTPRTTADGLETTFAVNVLAPHLLTSLLAAELRGRLLWLGSSSANFGRPDPATLGRPQQPSQAYSDSKACDVALALAWGRRLPRVASAAVDPGWVKTKLASAGAPGDVTSSADTLAYCCTEADLASAPYWKDRERRVGPVMHADKRDPVSGGRGRQYLDELLVAVTGERGNDHGVEAGIDGLTGAHVRVGVDPKDRQVSAVLVDQVRERRHAYRALAANRCDARRFVFGNDRQRAAQLLKHDDLRFDAVPLLEPDIAHFDGYDSGRAIVLRQHRLEHLGANRVAAPSDIEGKLRSQRANALGTSTLPLRPHQTQVCGRGGRIYLVQACLLSR
jgi:NAD(P)-dependent dehydrogenase (short-subunit alcohol dehydrogenase family)